MEIVKHTSLEESKDVVETLKWKIDMVEGKDKEAALADYIGLAIDNLTNKKDYLKSLADEIKNEIKRIDGQIMSIKHGAGEFLLGNGIKKLKGGIVSSVTVIEPKDEKTEPIIKQEVVVTGTEKEVNDALLALGLAEVKDVRVEKVIPAKPATIRVNKRKVVVPEVISGGQNKH